MKAWHVWCVLLGCPPRHLLQSTPTRVACVNAAPSLLPTHLVGLVRGSGGRNLQLLQAWHQCRGQVKGSGQRLRHRLKAALGELLHCLHCRTVRSGWQAGGCSQLHERLQCTPVSSGEFG